MSLAQAAWVDPIRGDWFGAAVDVDVQSAAPQEVHCQVQLVGFDVAVEVAEDAFGAFLVVALVFAIGTQVGQQAGLVDAGAGIADLDAGPVRLAGDGTGGTKQVRIQLLVKYQLVPAREQPGVRLKHLDTDVVTVQALARARHGGRRRASHVLQDDLDRRPADG